VDAGNFNFEKKVRHEGTFSRRGFLFVTGCHKRQKPERDRNGGGSGTKTARKSWETRAMGMFKGDKGS